MSIAASLNDLGALATSRASQPSRARTERQDSEREDGFAQVLRDSAKDRPEPPGRDSEWLQGRPRSEMGRAGENARPERPERPDKPERPEKPDRPEKPELPAAAREHRSEHAKRGEGPRRKDQPTPTDATDDAATAADAMKVDGSETTGSTPVTTEEGATQDVKADAATDAAKLASDAMLQTQCATSCPTAPVAPQATVPAAPQPTTDTAEPAVPAVGDAVNGVTATQAASVTATAGDTGAPAVDPQLPAPVAAPAAGESDSATVVQKAAEAVEATGASVTTKAIATATGEAEKADAAAPTEKSDDKAAVTGRHHEKKAHPHENNGLHRGANKPAGENEQAATPASPNAQGHEGRGPATAAAVIEALRGAGSEGQHAQNGASQPNGQAVGQVSGVAQVGAANPAAEARALASPQAAQRHEMPVPLQAVAIEIGMRAMRGSKEFAIRLDPEDLGRIDVKLEVSEAGQVQAKVVVDKVETLQLLQRDARTLERAFDQAGLKTTPDGLQFTLRDPGGQGRQGNDDQPSRSGRNNHQKDEPMIDEIRLQPAQYRIAASGGLDIRI